MDVIQTDLDSRLAAPSSSQISSAVCAAITQRMAIAPQSSATEVAGDNPVNSADDGSSSSLTGRRHEQSPLLSAVSRGGEAIRGFLRQAASWQRWERRGIVPRKLRELDPVQLPDQTNKLALAFSPLQSPKISFCCGLEVFQPSHVTTPHTHHGAWELFFIISGARGRQGFGVGIRFQD